MGIFWNIETSDQWSVGLMTWHPLTTGVHHGVRGLPPLEEPKTLRPGSLYFNYKKTFSVVLMALVDAEYRFRVVHIGAYGKSSDGGVFAESQLGRGLEAATLNVPEDAIIPAAEHLGNMPFTVFFLSFLSLEINTVISYMLCWTQYPRAQ